MSVHTPNFRLVVMETLKIAQTDTWSFKLKPLCFVMFSTILTPGSLVFQELMEFEVNFKDWYDSTKAGSRSGGSASWSRTWSILPLMSIFSYFIVAYG